VLLPGTELPLHIFEPRYRQMVADVLAGDREFGLAYKPAGVGEQGLAAGWPLCVAHVEEVETLEDGRSNIVVHGRERVAFARYVDAGTPYLSADVVPMPDAPCDPLTLESGAARVRELFERASAAASTIADDARDVPELPGDATRLSFVVAARLDLEPEARQRLLASIDPVERLDVLEKMLAPALRSLQQRADVHVRAKSNGKGPH
jgi:Lon protease-like protein